MVDLIVACVRTEGDPFERVTKLRDMVIRYMARDFTMVCLTDQPERCEGVRFIDIFAAELEGSWAKMVLFEPQWRERKKVLHLDLSVAVISDITPLADVPGEFAICGVIGKYNSSAMVIGGGMAGFVWESFERKAAALMARHRRVEDCIEELYPDATFLQWVLPKGFFRAGRVSVDSYKPTNVAAIYINGE
jgi:hypothetical protein